MARNMQPLKDQGYNEYIIVRDYDFNRKFVRLPYTAIDPTPRNIRYLRYIVATWFFTTCNI